MYQQIALIGNPNAGKTSVYNWLTGAHQRVGNWSGVTVCESSAEVQIQERPYKISDLPGIYTLTTVDLSQTCMDEKLSVEALDKHWDLVINVVDGTQLSRHLYLTLQLLEQGLPVLLVVNMSDAMARAGQYVDAAALSKGLGCPVVFVSAAKQEGLKALEDAIVQYQAPKARERIAYPPVVEAGIVRLSKYVDPQQVSAGIIIKLLEGDCRLRGKLPVSLPSEIRLAQDDIEKAEGHSADIMIAKARYHHIDTLIKHAVTKTGRNPWGLSVVIDRWVLNRWLAFPIFLGVLYTLFFVSIGLGGSLQPFFELSSKAIFVEGIKGICDFLAIPHALTAILATGVGIGISTLLTFIPVIGAMFFCLSLLEDSGYMSRAAFVMDRFMQSIGLPGKSFVPMIIGFGCNVPAVMAARTLETRQDRILTTMMMPFMSCGARLAIYTVFVSAFFYEYGALVVLGLYLLGVFMAVMTGLILKKTLLTGKTSSMIMELPPYRIPRMSVLRRQTWRRLSTFIKSAGTIIIPVCVLLGVLNAFGTDGSFRLDGEPNQNSMLAAIGQKITPIFSPMGIEQQNWPATVGLLTGTLAKEVVVGTLNTLYHPAAQTGAEQGVMATLTEAVHSLPFMGSDATPVASGALFGEMNARFGGKNAALAYLVFVLLYMPCVSTVASMVKEVGRDWAILSVTWTTLVAYCAAVTFYQVSIWWTTPWTASLWILGMILMLAGSIRLTPLLGSMHSQNRRRLPTPIVTSTH